MKRLLTMLLCLVMCLSLMPAALAEETADSRDVGRPAGIAPNQRMDPQKIKIDEIYTGQLTDATDRIRYQFTLKESGVLTVAANATNKSILYYIFDAEGTELSFEKSDMSDDGTNYHFLLLSLTKGTYTLEVGKYDHHTSAITGTNGTFKFTMSFVAAEESFNDAATNNSTAEASKIKTGKEYRAFLTNNDSADYFTFTLKRSGWVRLTLTVSNQGAFYYILDKDGKIVKDLTLDCFYSSQEGEANVRVALTKGRYYFVASRNSLKEGNTRIGPLTIVDFRLRFSDAKETYNDNGSNNEIAKAGKISVNKTYRSFLAANDSKDYFKFSVSKAGEAKLHISAEGEAVNYLIYGENGRIVHSGSSTTDEKTGKNKTDETVRLEKGTYYLAISREFLDYCIGDDGKVRFYIIEPEAKKPKITQSPVSVNAKAGETVTFTVKAEGNGKTYQWYYRENSKAKWKKTNLPGSDTATLTVYAKDSRNGFEYYCRVSNLVGKSNSRGAKLTVSGDARPEISEAPKSKTAKSGETVKFTVKSKDATGYQWYYRTSKDGEWTECANGKKATLTVEAKSFRSGYQYCCQVFKGEAYVYTSAVTLTVK